MSRVAQIKTPIKSKPQKPGPKHPRLYHSQEKNIDFAKFFNSCPWDKWWHEFLTARDEKGLRMKYLYAWGFAKEKATSSAELEVIFRAIGPRPPQLDRTMLVGRPVGRVVPHLGDWQQLRAKAYFSDRESASAIRKACAERLDGLEAGRSAATVICDFIERWMKYDDKIDEVFDGTPVVEGLSLDAQEKRSELFFRQKERTMNAVLKLIDKYLACYGISTTCANDIGALAAAVTTSAAKQLVAGTSEILDPNSLAFGYLTRAIFDKTKTFNMTAPTVVADDMERHFEADRESAEHEVKK